jgi:hypothetical protein
VSLVLSLVMFDARSIRSRLSHDEGSALADLTEYYNEDLGDGATPETVVDLIENHIGAPVHIGEIDDPYLRRESLPEA